MKFARGTLLSRFITWVATLAAAWVPAVTHAAPPAEVKLDYAYYSPESLVIKRQGWLEKELAPDHTQVKWVLSLGSNRALEYLNSNAIDIGSTAGLAALLGRANGNPIRAVYIYSRAEWTALVVRKDSPLKTLADLKGKKIAATKGTDPYLFTLRADAIAGSVVIARTLAWDGSAPGHARSGRSALPLGPCAADDIVG